MKKWIKQLWHLYSAYVLVVMSALFVNTLFWMLKVGTATVDFTFNKYGEYYVELALVLLAVPGFLYWSIKLINNHVERIYELEDEL